MGLTASQPVPPDGAKPHKVTQSEIQKPKEARGSDAVTPAPTPSFGSIMYAAIDAMEQLYEVLTGPSMGVLLLTIQQDSEKISELSSVLANFSGCAASLAALQTQIQVLMSAQQTAKTEFTATTSAAQQIFHELTMFINTMGKTLNTIAQGFN